MLYTREKEYSKTSVNENCRKFYESYKDLTAAEYEESGEKRILP